MSSVLTLGQVAKLGTILGVWAHPDDESFMMAGLMAAAVQNGQTVACITATRGEKGTQDEAKWPAAMLGKVREKELEDALKLTGVQHHHWLDYPDGGCHEIDDNKAAQKILKLIEHYRPDTVITFPPNGLTGHLDHVSVSRWAGQALKKWPHHANLYYGVDTVEQYESFTKKIDEKFNIYFNIDEPCLIPEQECDIVLSLTPDLCLLKHDVLTAMPSQTELMVKDFGKDFIVNGLCNEAFVRADKPIGWNNPRQL